MRARGHVRRGLVLLASAALAAAGAVVLPAATAYAGPHAAPAATAGSRPIVDAPPMGWNDWNSFGCDVSAQLIEQTADVLVSSGLRDAGYRYVNIDDCWSTKNRDADGRLVPDPSKFPDGITAVADYVHQRGLKLGIYADAGTATCAGYPGSLGHEQVDARTFASWGVDLLKYDNCNNQGQSAPARYQAMADALAASGRDIVFSICEWGTNKPWRWAPAMGDYWRIDGDITDAWTSVKSIGRQLIRHYTGWSGPGFPDPDMLEVGNGGLSPVEERTHVGLWALYGAPLILGADLRSLDADSMAAVSNKDVIAVDQQAAGRPVRQVSSDRGTTVFARGMADGSTIVALYNESDTPAPVATTAAAAGLPTSAGYTVKDLWSGTTTTSTGELADQVPAHGLTLLQVKPARVAQNAAPVMSFDAPRGAGVPLFLAGSDPLPATVTLTAPKGGGTLSDVTVNVDVPGGWSTTGETTQQVGRIKQGETRRLTWPLTANDDRASTVTATVSWRDGSGEHSRDLSLRVVPTPAQPHGTTRVSDLPWLESWSGYAEPQRDMGIEGQTLSVAGTKFDHGVGSHGESEIGVWLGGNCRTLTTSVGVQDGNPSGSIQGIVEGDGKQLAATDTMTAGEPAQKLTVDVSGVHYLVLHTGVGGDSSYSDRVVWGGTELSCAGLSMSGPSAPFAPGVAQQVTTSVTAIQQGATDVTAELTGPEGWDIRATSPTTAASLDPGEALTTTWDVTAPAGVASGNYDLSGTASYDVDGEAITDTATLRVSTVPSAPAKDTYASDLDWISATNGWGPVERDSSVGENGSGDGNPITLAGTVYDKGLGTNAPSTIRYYLGGNCQSFTADVGLDDEQPSRGSVSFAVVADGVTKTQTGVFTPTTATGHVDADITGAQYVELVVGDGGDGNGNDHGDWADALFHCGG